MVAKNCWKERTIMAHMRQQLWATVTVLILLLPTISWAGPRPVASVLTVKGQVVVKRRAAAKFAALPRNASLFVGDVVGTGPNGKAKLIFSDSSQWGLNANSAIEIT